MPSFKQFQGGDYPRLYQRSIGNSALYTLLTDATKPIALPFSMNDIIDGTGNGQYSIVTSVPVGCRGFIPNWVTTVATGATTARVNQVNLTFTHASVAVCYLMFFGRFNTQSGIYANDPFAAGLTNVVNPATYGHWKMLARVNYTTTAGGTAAAIAYEDWQSQHPLSAAVPTWGGTGNLNRTYVTTAAGQASGGPALFQYPSMTAASSFSQLSNPNSMELGVIPTNGATEIAACFTFSSANAGTIASSVAMATGTGTVQSIGLAAQFVS